MGVLLLDQLCKFLSVSRWTLTTETGALISGAKVSCLGEPEKLDNFWGVPVVIYSGQADLFDKIRSAGVAPLGDCKLRFRPRMRGKIASLEVVDIVR